jgi:hypothetical protein
MGSRLDFNWQNFNWQSVMVLRYHFQEESQQLAEHGQESQHKSSPELGHRPCLHAMET